MILKIIFMTPLNKTRDFQKEKWSLQKLSQILINYPVSICNRFCSLMDFIQGFAIHILSSCHLPHTIFLNARFSTKNLMENKIPLQKCSNNTCMLLKLTPELFNIVESLKNEESSNQEIGKITFKPRSGRFSTIN